MIIYSSEFVWPAMLLHVFPGLVLDRNVPKVMKSWKKSWKKSWGQFLRVAWGHEAEPMICTMGKWALERWRSWASELENTKPSSQANVSNSGRPHKLRVDELPLARVKCSMHSKHYAVMQTDCAWVSGLDQFSSRLKDWSMCAITSSHHHNKTPNNIKRIYKTNIVPLDTTNHSIHQTTICKTNQHHP